MLRIKRSVAASFSQLHFNTAIIDSATGPSSSGAARALAHGGCLGHQQLRATRMQRLAQPALALVPYGRSAHLLRNFIGTCHAGSAVFARMVVEHIMTYTTCPRGGAGTVEAGVGKRKRDDMADLEAQLPEVLLGFRVALTCDRDCDASCIQLSVPSCTLDQGAQSRHVAHGGVRNRTGHICVPADLALFTMRSSRSSRQAPSCPASCRPASSSRASSSSQRQTPPPPPPPPPQVTPTLSSSGLLPA